MTDTETNALVHENIAVNRLSTIPQGESSVKNGQHTALGNIIKGLIVRGVTRQISGKNNIKGR